MLNLGQQQDPGLIGAVTGLEGRVDPVFKYVLAAVLGVGGFFFGVHQTVVPVALCIGLGIVLGLLLVPLVLNGIGLAIGILLVAAAALGTFWLLNNDAALKRPASAPVRQVQPADPSTDLRLYRF